MYQLFAPAGAPELVKSPAPPAPAALMSMGGGSGHCRGSGRGGTRGGAADAATEGASAHAIAEAEAAAPLEATTSAGVVRESGTLHSLTVHGNQLSHTTYALWRTRCVAPDARAAA